MPERTPNMHDIIIIQHCQSEHHINELSGGWTDTPLTNLGQEQARKVGQRLLNEIDPSEYMFYSSDLLRASQTAEIVGNLIGISPILDSRIRERSFGIATGKTKEWFGNNVDLTKIPTLDQRPIDKAETSREFYLRIEEFLNDLDNSNTSKVILVTHGGVVSQIITWWLKLPIDVLETSTFGTKVGGISKLQIRYEKIRTLSVLSDISHFNK